MNPRLTALAATGVMLVAAGCQRDPLDRAVAAPTPSAFASWRARIETDSGVELRRRVGEAMQEIRLRMAGNQELRRAMDESAKSASSDIDEAVRRYVDGRRLRDVIQAGYGWRVERLKGELAGLENAMAQNAQLATAAGDLESRHYLDGLRDRQRARVEKYRADIATAERELAPSIAK